MTSGSVPSGKLEENVRRLFGRLEKVGPGPGTRDRILHGLLREVPPSRSTRSAGAVRRAVRWAGLAAILFVALGLLTGDVEKPGGARVRRAAAERASPVSFAIHLLAGGPGRGVVEASGPEGGEPVHIQAQRQVSNADVQAARVRRSGSRCEVEIRLTGEGTEKLAELTRGHVGERLALVIDGKVVMTPTIRSPITQGLVALTGDFSEARCQEIARGLSAGG